MNEIAVQTGKPRILAVVPARGGSKGLKKKNIRRLGERPLICHVIDAAIRSKWIDRLILSSENEMIIEAVQGMAIDVPFRRPESLGSDNASLAQVVHHAYNFFRDLNEIYDAVICIQPTNPFTSTRTIDNVIQLWRKYRCDSVVTISEIRKGHPYIARKLLPDAKIEPFSPIPEGAVVAPRQKRIKAYALTGALYLRDRRLLENGIPPNGHFLGKDVRGVVVDDIEGVDINDELDFNFAEFLIEREYTQCEY